jgi:DNA-binding response OmpR family regulator
MIKPDLIILDLMMPGVSGFSLLEVIKNDQETKNIPVMILSAIQENTTIKKAIQCGAAGYMKKPMNVEEVMKIIIKTLKD